MSEQRKTTLARHDRTDCLLGSADPKTTRGGGHLAIVSQIFAPTLSIA